MDHPQDSLEGLQIYLKTTNYGSLQEGSDGALNINFNDKCQRALEDLQDQNITVEEFLTLVSTYGCIMQEGPGENGRVNTETGLLEYNLDDDPSTNGLIPPEVVVVTLGTDNEVRIGSNMWTIRYGNVLNQNFALAVASVPGTTKVVVGFSNGDFSRFHVSPQVVEWPLGYKPKTGEYVFVAESNGNVSALLLLENNTIDQHIIAAFNLSPTGIGSLQTTFNEFDAKTAGVPQGAIPMYLRVNDVDGIIELTFQKLGDDGSLQVYIVELKLTDGETDFITPND